MPKNSVGRVLLAVLAALFVVMIQPAMFMTSMLICTAPIAIALLYAWGGWIPAGVASVGTIASLVQFAGLAGVKQALAGLGAALVLVAPGIVSIVLMEKRMSFFKRMAIAVGVQTAGQHHDFSQREIAIGIKGTITLTGHLADRTDLGDIGIEPVALLYV